MKTRVYLKYFVHDDTWKQLFASNSSPALLNLICLTILVIPTTLTQFQPNLEQLMRKNMLKFVLLDNCLILLFSIFSLRSKFGIESLSSLVLSVFQKDKVNFTQNTTVSKTAAVAKDIKSKIKFCWQSLSQNFGTFSCLTKFPISPQVKPSMIISNKHGLYEMLHELLIWLTEKS